MNIANDLLRNLDKLHTTERGVARIKKNLNIDTELAVKYCYNKILEENTIINRKGKNWYATTNNCIISVNAYTFTIITAHSL
ncbi:MAG: DUF3781 domain-containing protein [Spirochaetaceae bacterium]|nr:DUF3781 domain-containing protein [Spirochaetaceae bacterium]